MPSLACVACWWCYEHEVRIWPAASSGSTLSPRVRSQTARLRWMKVRRRVKICSRSPAQPVPEPPLLAVVVQCWAGSAAQPQARPRARTPAPAP